MIVLIVFLYAQNDLHGLVYGGLAHCHRLKAPLKGRVLLDVLSVLVEGGGAYNLYLAPGQGGL